MVPLTEDFHFWRETHGGDAETRSTGNCYRESLIKLKDTLVVVNWSHPFVMESYLLKAGRTPEMPEDRTIRVGCQGWWE
jgi:hypothetical protein